MTFDSSSAVSTDGAGGAYHGTLVETQFVSPGNVLISRFDPTGQLLWSDGFGADGEDSVNVLVPDGVEGVFAAGFTTGDLFGTGNARNDDAWLARYDGVGNQLWIRPISGAGVDAATGAHLTVPVGCSYADEPEATSVVPTQENKTPGSVASMPKAKSCGRCSSARRRSMQRSTSRRMVKAVFLSLDSPLAPSLAPRLARQTCGSGALTPLAPWSGIARLERASPNSPPQRFPTVSVA